MDFIRAEISKGRQAYIIFPLIEESETLDYENLMKGYENVKAYFPEPKYWISMVHGRQKSDVKETNMQRFAKNDTQIMVSTTVIEVGVNVPNATVMVIESAEKFGLSQLHQLRGRVGRSEHKSFCILLTGPKLNSEARERLQTMCSTNDGFKIAEKDLELAHFYQALIQAAGAFVHLQKNFEYPLHAKHGRRLRPAARLFALALRNLEQFPNEFRALSLEQFRQTLARYRDELSESHFQRNPWSPQSAPQFSLSARE